MAAAQSLYQLHTLNRRWFNTTLLRRRQFDGHIVSMQQSGSHWVKNLLGHTLRKIHNLPEASHIQDDSIIGHPKNPPRFEGIPRIVHSHSYPHALTLRLPLHFPRYLVLVRDLRDSLISHYERFKPDYAGADWDDYLRGDIHQKRFYSDIYSRIRFMNEWARLLNHYPERVHAVRYEDLKEDTQGELKKMVDFFRIEGATEEILSEAVAASTRERMAENPNPEITTTVVRTESRPPLEHYFTPENQAFFEDTCRRYLTHSFGYDYPTVK